MAIPRQHLVSRSLVAVHNREILSISLEVSSAAARLSNKRLRVTQAV